MSRVAANIAVETFQVENNSDEPGALKQMHGRTRPALAPGARERHGAGPVRVGSGGHQEGCLGGGGQQRRLGCTLLTGTSKDRGQESTLETIPRGLSAHSKVCEPLQGNAKLSLLFLLAREIRPSRKKRA